MLLLLPSIWYILKNGTYGEFQQWCRQKNYTPPSFKTWLKMATAVYNNEYGRKVKI